MTDPVTNSKAPNPPEGEADAETPEDVAVLYSWANLEGARYRDFSASRREYRAQLRHRAAEELHQSELRAQAAAEHAAAVAEGTAHEAERRARTTHGYESSVERNRALRDAEAAARQAAAERVEAARRATAAAAAAATTRLEEREIADAQASVQRQTAHWAEWNLQRHHLAGPQPNRTAPRLLSDPYQYAPANSTESDFFLPSTQLQYTQVDQSQRQSASSRPASSHPTAEQTQETSPETRFTRMGDPNFARVHASNTPLHTLQQAKPASGMPLQTHPKQPDSPRSDSTAVFAEPGPSTAPEVLLTLHAETHKKTVAGITANTPAWLSLNAMAVPATPASKPSPQPESQKTSRWSALRSGFGAGEEAVTPSLEKVTQRLQPLIFAVFSPLGGTGKTSLVATLGRALALIGEKVLLVDATSLGLLAFYFGPDAPPPVKVRTLSPVLPEESGKPIRLVTYAFDYRQEGEAAQLCFVEDLARDSNGTDCILIDLDVGSAQLLLTHKAFPLPLTLLVPLAPDMNSVLGLQAIEALSRQAVDSGQPPFNTHYVLTQFDLAIPLHLDVRKVLQAHLGDRLLPLVISRSPAVPEAFAEGTTVIDYAPQSAVAEEYRQLAAWLHRIPFPAQMPLDRQRRSQD